MSALSSLAGTKRCSRFFGAVTACLFSKKHFVGHPTPLHQPVLFSAMPRRTAHSRIKYDERYYRWKRPSPNPQRLKAFRWEFSLSIIGATENRCRLSGIIESILLLRDRRLILEGLHRSCSTGLSFFNDRPTPGCVAAEGEIRNYLFA